MNIHNGKTQQRIGKTQRAATHSNAQRSNAQRSCRRRQQRAAVHCTATRHAAQLSAAQRSVCVNGPLESKTLILDQACQVIAGVTVCSRCSIAANSSSPGQLICSCMHHNYSRPRIASAIAEDCYILVVLFYFIFFRPPNFRHPWADFRETLPHDAVCAEIVYLL